MKTILSKILNDKLFAATTPTLFCCMIIAIAAKQDASLSSLYTIFASLAFATAILFFIFIVYSIIAKKRIDEINIKNKGRLDILNLIIAIIWAVMRFVPYHIFGLWVIPLAALAWIYAIILIFKK